MSVSPTVVSTPWAHNTSNPFAREEPRLELALLIEDDDLVAGMVERILSRRVRRVLRARDGAEGAQLFAEYETRINLVMVDCCLPDVDGVALCRVLRRISPELPFILTSGWDNEAAQTLAQEPSIAFLLKPFRPAELEAQIVAVASVAA